MNQRMPLLFIGHGSPMNAIEDNRWSRALIALGKTLPRPRALLVVSAHWQTRGTCVTANPQPPTIHDFGGFPDALHQLQYPASGDATLVKRVCELLPGCKPTMEWGLDHGAWSVLVHTHPQADVPVVQLSMDVDASPEAQVQMGRALAPLRDEGVMIVASGNLIHNLRDFFQRMQTGDESIPAWAQEFADRSTRAIEQRDTAELCRLPATDAGRMSHPTAEHYLPLLYVMGAVDENDGIRYPVTGFDFGALSMRSVVWSPAS